jgi:hypothetical protein
MELYHYCPYIHGVDWKNFIINHYQHGMSKVKIYCYPFTEVCPYPFPILPENMEGFYFHLRLWAMSKICHDYDHIPSDQSLKVELFLNVLQ